MTQTETYRHQRTYRSAGMLAAVLAVTVLSLAAAAVLSEESEADITVEHEIIYGFPDVYNYYEITGSSEAGWLTFELSSEPYGVGLDIDDLVIPERGVFKAKLTVNTNGMGKNSQYTITVDVFDSAGQTAQKVFTLKMIDPSYPELYEQPFNVIANNNSVIDLSMKGFPQTGKMPTNYDEKYTLLWDSGESSAVVEYGEHGIKLPGNLPAGSNTCRLKAEITCGNVQTYLSPEFTVNVQAKPTFDLAKASYFRDPGEDITVSLDLTGIDVPGTWTVDKPTKKDETLAYTANAVDFKISGVQADDVGTYKVSFKASGGAASDVVQFEVKLYKTVSSGVVTLDGLLKGNVLKAGSSSLKTDFSVTENVPYTMKVLNGEQQDVTEQFGLSKDKIVLQTKLAAGSYMFVFYATGAAEKMVQEVTLEYHEPPSITGIKPVSGFDIN